MIDPSIPPPKGKPVTLTVFVDADHARDEVTCRSTTGILAFLNCTPIRWYSKRQATVEASTYGSELVTSRIAAEMIIELRYGLRVLVFQSYVLPISLGITSPWSLTLLCPLLH